MKSKNWFRGQSVRKRFSLTVVCMCIIPLIASATIVFFRSYSDAAKRYTDYVEQMTEQIENNLQSRFFRLRTDAIDLAYNVDVQDFVYASSIESPSIGRVPINASVAHSITGKFNTTSDGSSLLMITPNGSICYTYNNRSAYNIYLKSSFINNLIDQINRRNAGFWYYITTDDYYMKNLVGKVLPPDTTEPRIFFSLKMKRSIGDEYVGYLIMAMRPDLLNGIFEKSKLEGLSKVYLIDEEGNTIISSEKQRDQFKEDILSSILSRQTEKISTYAKNNKFTRDYIIYTQLDEIGWYLVSIIDGKALSRFAFSNCYHILVLLFFMLILIPLVFIVINRSISKPLEKIVSNIGKIQHGDFTARINDTGDDEFTQISNSIDAMTSNLGNLVEKVRISEQLYSETQIELLQMQMNPHFITSILNTVAWMADIHEQTNISKVIKRLSALINQTLRSGREFIPLEDELNYIRWYIEIQNYRSTYRYCLNIDVDDSLLKYLLPPFTLEPLVENSVIHGTVNGRESLDITIRAVRNGNKIECTVVDNGKGMDLATLSKLGTSTQIQRNKLYRIHGISVSNVRKRLQLYFGKEYGLTYDSKLGHFTIATVSFPACFSRKDKELGNI